MRLLCAEEHANKSVSDPDWNPACCSAVREEAAALLEALHAENPREVEDALADAGVRPTQQRELAARFARGGGAPHPNGGDAPCRSGGRRDSATTSELEALSEVRRCMRCDGTVTLTRTHPASALLFIPAAFLRVCSRSRQRPHRV